MEAGTTLYQLADKEIRECIAAYLPLAEATQNFANVKAEHLIGRREIVILLAGVGVREFNVSKNAAISEWQRRTGVQFDTETAITTSVYENIRNLGCQFLDHIESSTDSFKIFDPTFIRSNPYLLPLFQHLAQIFSKAKLKKLVGGVSDTAISKPASERIAKLLSDRVDPQSLNKGEILKRLESTLEGIVRDLVGRVLLESIVASALDSVKVPYKREEDYNSLRGVIYDFRADFVLPNAETPLAFIEVRKSSSRHASLYAKDKMFSAINWKGKNKKLLAVLVVDGEWTRETLLAMAKIFDYVIPVTRSIEVAQIIKDYIEGDCSKLKWLVNFSIASNLVNQQQSPK